MSYAYKKAKEELICDLAQYYGIYDLTTYPVSFIATLSFGLPQESRVMLKLSDQKVDPKTMILAAIYDSLAALLWSRSKDGQKGRNRPKLLVDSLQKSKSQSKDLVGYASADLYRQARKEIIDKLKKEGDKK